LMLGVHFGYIWLVQRVGEKEFAIAVLGGS
jgi:hypothetical protein